MKTIVNRTKFFDLFTRKESIEWQCVIPAISGNNSEGITLGRQEWYRRTVLKQLKPG